MRFIQFEGRNVSLCSLRSEYQRKAMGSDLLAILRINGIFEYQVSRSKTSIVQLHFHCDIGRAFRYIPLSNIYTRRGTIGNCNVILFSNNQPYRTIDTSVNPKKIVIYRNHIRT